MGVDLEIIEFLVLGLLEPVEEGYVLGLLDMAYQSALFFSSWIPMLLRSASTDMLAEQDSLSKLTFFVSSERFFLGQFFVQLRNDAQILVFNYVS